MKQNPRPKRKHIPIAVKREVAERQNGICRCGCGFEFAAFNLHTMRWETLRGATVHFDHDPALRLRDVNRRRTDYIPPQNDPKYLVARCVASHKIKTIGAGTSRKRSMAGTDIGKITKERGRSRVAAAKRLRRVSEAAKANMGLSGPQKRNGANGGQWVSRKIPSRPFPKMQSGKVYRPFRKTPGGGDL